MLKVNHNCLIIKKSNTMKCKNILTLLIACLAISFSQGQDTIFLKKGTRILAFNTYCGEWNIQYYENGSGNTDRIVKSISTDLVSSVVSSSGDTLFYMGKVITSKSPNVMVESRTKDVVTSQGDSLASKGNVLSQSLKLSTNDVSSSGTKNNDRTNTSHLAISPQYKNPAIAYLFSYLPGGGQFYNDEIGKGFTFMICTGLCAGATYGFYEVSKVSKGNNRENYATTAAVFGVATVALYIWQAIDAVVTADRKNKMNGYVLSFTPSILDNHLACAVGGSGYVPAMSFNLSF